LVQEHDQGYDEPCCTDDSGPQCASEWFQTAGEPLVRQESEQRAEPIVYGDWDEQVR
jgi:hypothetical protein